MGKLRFRESSLEELTCLSNRWCPHLRLGDFWGEQSQTPEQRRAESKTPSHAACIERLTQDKHTGCRALILSCAARRKSTRQAVMETSEVCQLRRVAHFDFLSFPMEGLPGQSVRDTSLCLAAPHSSLAGLRLSMNPVLCTGDGC